MGITVANRRRYTPDGTPVVAITPPSPLANPFKMSRSMDREALVARYAAWLDAQLRGPRPPPRARWRGCARSWRSTARSPSSAITPPCPIPAT